MQVNQKTQQAVVASDNSPISAQFNRMDNALDAMMERLITLESRLHSVLVELPVLKEQASVDPPRPPMSVTQARAIAFNEKAEMILCKLASITDRLEV